MVTPERLQSPTRTDVVGVLGYFAGIEGFSKEPKDIENLVSALSSWAESCGLSSGGLTTDYIGSILVEKRSEIEECARVIDECLG